MFADDVVTTVNNVFPTTADETFRLTSVKYISYFRFIYTVAAMVEITAFPITGIEPITFTISSNLCLTRRQSLYVNWKARAVMNLQFIIFINIADIR